MGPGGIGTTRGSPTDGLKNLLSLLRRRGSNPEKLATFISVPTWCTDGAAVPDDPIDLRYQASLDPEVVASPPLQRPSGLRTPWRMDLTRDKRLRHPAQPDPGAVGPRRQGQPADGRAAAAEDDAQRRTGDDLAHRPLDAVGTRGLFNQLVADFLSLTFEIGRFATDVFGGVHLGYLVIETEKFDDWRRFGRDAIGMHLDETLPRRCGSASTTTSADSCSSADRAEDTTALGWRVDDHGAFEVIEKRVRSHGVPVTEGTAEETALRGVERLIHFPGPNGLTRRCTSNPASARRPPARRHGRLAGGPARAGGRTAIATRSRIRCAGTTARCSTPGCRTTSTRRSAA